MDFTTARRNMVDSQVRTNNVTDMRIQKAMLEIAREPFLPSHLKEQAYVERDIEYSDGRYMMRARDFSKLLAMAAPTQDDVVLNAVCGNGYSSAVLAQLAGMVMTLEADEAAIAKTESVLSELGVSNVAVVQASPKDGLRDQGPFDLIFVDMAIGMRPEELLGQLRDGGRLAAIVCEGGTSQGVLYQRNGDGISQKSHFDAACRTITPDFEAAPAFTF